MFLDQAAWTVFTPRPADTARFATAPSDAGLQILGDVASLEVLGHLLWATAFQDRGRTLILIDLPFVTASASGAPPSLPIALVNASLGVPSAAALSELRSELPLTRPSEGTVRLRTAGLDRAVGHPKAFEAKERADEDAPVWDPTQWCDWMYEIGGIAMFAAPPAVLRGYARATAEFGAFSWVGLDATEPFAPDDRPLVFDRTIVARAAALRTRRASLFPERAHADLLGHERAQLWELTREC